MIASKRVKYLEIHLAKKVLDMHTKIYKHHFKELRKRYSMFMD